MTIEAIAGQLGLTEITDPAYLANYGMDQAVHVGHDPDGVPCIWLELNPAHPVSELEVLLIGTGKPIDNRFAGGHAGSFLDGRWMGHVYRR